MPDGAEIREQLQRFIDGLQQHQETVQKQRARVEDARSLIEQADPKIKDDLLSRLTESDRSLDSALSGLDQAQQLADELLQKI